MILNFNGLQYLSECLDSVYASTYPNLDVYVVDNGSVDGSCEYVRVNFPRVKLIRFKNNLGFATAYNVAVNSVETDYVVLLNNDTSVRSDFVQELVERAESDKRIGSVGCKIVQLDGRRRYGPVFFTGNGSFIGPLFFGSVIGRDAVYSTYDTETECIANCGAAVLYRKSLIDEIGLFDAEYWSDWEDHDLGFRICVAGARNLYTPSTVVLHKGGASFGQIDSRHRVVRMTKNMLFTYFKNYESRNIALRLLPLLFCVLPYREMAVILENEFGLAFRRDVARRRKLRATYLASGMGCWQFLRGLRRVMEKRQAVQAIRRVSDGEIIKRTSKHLI
jgi:GT2 family glycosyltransferase